MADGDRRESLGLRAWPLTGSLESGAILDKCPCLLRAENTAVFMFFDSEKQSRALPHDCRVEFVAISSDRRRDVPVGSVFLHGATGVRLYRGRSRFRP